VRSWERPSLPHGGGRSMSNLRRCLHIRRGGFVTGSPKEEAPPKRGLRKAQGNFRVVTAGRLAVSTWSSQL
jgi:hypothetical protein